jgi:hypothetical protein
MVILARLQNRQCAAQRRAAIPQSRESDVAHPLQGTLGREGILLAPGICEVTPPVALLTAHEARMSVACCATYPCSMLVALGSGRCELPAKVVAAAAEITAGLLKSDGDAAAGFGTWLPIAEHSALFAADC